MLEEPKIQMPDKVESTQGVAIYSVLRQSMSTQAHTSPPLELDCSDELPSASLRLSRFGFRLVMVMVIGRFR